MIPRAFFDLDGTLIYSKRSAQTDINNLVPVEKYKDKWISYMTPRAVELLEDLIKSGRLVPSTTRTVEQFERINFSSQVRWAITCNGAAILKDGHEVKSWTKHIASLLPRNRQKVFTSLGDLADSHGWMNRVVRDSFFYMVTPSDLDEAQHDAIHSLIRHLDSEDWATSIQSRKIYVLPRLIDKAVAMEEVMSLSGGSLAVAAGDSRLDLSMMLEADRALRPSHGELWIEDDESQPQYGIAHTHASGCAAAEEILALALNL